MTAKALVTFIVVAGTLVAPAHSQVCDVPVPGEIFCDEFGPDSGPRWVNVAGEADTHLEFEDGIAKLTGTFIPEVKPIGGSQPDVSIQAVGRLVQGGSLGVGARLENRSYFIGSEDIATGRQDVFLALGAPFERIHDVDVPFSPFDQFVAFQLDVFSDRISYRIWPATEPMPVEPMTTVTDATLTSGDVYLWTASAVIPPIEFAAADFVYMRTAAEPIASYQPLPVGDFDGDGLLTVVDLDLLTAQSASGAHDALFDVTGDATVNDGDVSYWVTGLFHSWVGDIDLNGEFNSSDLVVMLSSGTYEADRTAVWSTGDFDGDGHSNSSDLIAALADGGYEQGPRAAVTTVPEPAGIVLVVVAFIGVSIVPRSRSKRV